MRRLSRVLGIAAALIIVVACGEAASTDPAQIVTEARARGIGIPYVFYVEAADKDVVKMGL